MATTVDTLLVRIEADMRDVRRDLAALEKRTETASRSISKSMGRIGTVTQAVIGGVLVQQFSRGILSLTNFASDMEEMSAMSEAVFGRFVGSVREQLEEFGTSVGRSSFELEAMAASVQDTFVPLGFARGTAADLSVQLTKLAVDVGSFKNELETDVMAAFQSALVGNHEAVRRFGIVITEAELKNELLRMGIKEAAKDVDAQTKVQARLNLILAGTTDAQGDAARTAGSYANLTRALDAEVKLLAKDLGDELLPTMKAVVIQTTEIVKGFRKFLVAIGLVSGKHQDLIDNLDRVKKAEKEVAKFTKLTTGSYINNQFYAGKLTAAQIELAAALDEQDRLLKPIIDDLTGVETAVEGAAQSTEKLTTKMTEGEKVVRKLDLELRKLKADSDDTTGITSELLAIQSKLGDEYGQHALLIEGLLTAIHEYKTEQELSAQAAEQQAEELIILADSFGLITEAIDEAAKAQSDKMTAAFLEGSTEIGNYRELVRNLKHENDLLQQSIDGVSEAEMLANQIIKEHNLEHRTQQETVRELVTKYFELKHALNDNTVASEQAADATIAVADSFAVVTEEIEKFEEANKKAVEAASTVPDAIMRIAAEMKKFEVESTEATIAVADSFALISEEIHKFESKTKELTPMMQEMKSALEGVARGIGDSFADMVVDGKFSLDSFEDIFKNFVKRMISKAIEMFIIEQIFSKAFPSFGFAGGGAIPARAGGGTTAGPVLVGERGPELFVPSSAGVIRNNHDTKNILGGSSSVVNQSINIDAGVSQTVRAEIMTMMPVFKQQALEAVVESRRRGGQVASAFGR